MAREILLINNVLFQRAVNIVFLMLGMMMLIVKNIVLLYSKMNRSYLFGTGMLLKIDCVHVAIIIERTQHIFL